MTDPGSIDRGDDFTERRRALEAMVSDPATSPSNLTQAHYMLWEVCQGCGDSAAALEHLELAMALNPVRTRHVPGAVPRRSLLCLAAPGGFQANLPIDMLLDGTTRLHTLWLTDPLRILAEPSYVMELLGRLPPVDGVLVAIAQDHRHAAHLAAADLIAARVGRPVFNSGKVIAGLSREGAALLLQQEPDLRIAPPIRVDRDALLVASVEMPFIVRPVESHAGHALERIDGEGLLRNYLARHEREPAFYISEFIDYAGADSFYRKCRIVFVDHRPYPVHLAIHDDWAVWYYNARMECDLWKREEEASFMSDMPRALGPRAMVALLRIASLIDLDYFGIDCAVAADGRLIVFEIETGMIVHDRDPKDMFPYKSPAIGKISAAFAAMLDHRGTVLTSS